MKQTLNGPNAAYVTVRCASWTIYTRTARVDISHIASRIRAAFTFVENRFDFGSPPPRNRSIRHEVYGGLPAVVLQTPSEYHFRFPYPTRFFIPIPPRPVRDRTGIARICSVNGFITNLNYLRLHIYTVCFCTLRGSDDVNRRIKLLSKNWMAPVCVCVSIRWFLDTFDLL